MKVTEVRISPAKGGKVRAFASVVFDDCFIVNDLRVVEGREGQFFVTMPARKTRNGQMRDIAHPLNGETREQIEALVLDEYESAVQNLIVPDRSVRDGAGEEKRLSLMERLSARLFNEEFWTTEATGRTADKE
ncbi:MAG: SpoVG family protein [Acidobacteria bacterium]|nr:SpoVG family protein [Acidobacteriota bacterium]